ncbi:MAG: Hsp20/alpha crystallin family protein [Desulfovibrio desulfuricans]|nr:Hsp20/alpha crystallin family protein [Desulfovibrio desulfuricans]
MNTTLTPSRWFAPREAMLRNAPVRGDIDRFFNNFFDGMVTPWTSEFFRNFRKEDALMPRVDLTSDDKAYTLKVEVPGVEPDDVKLSVHDGMLEISGEKKCETEDKEKHVMERSFGSFRRAMSLAEDADIDAISAAHRNGVLTVTIPRLAEAGNKEKVITIEKA